MEYTIVSYSPRYRDDMIFCLLAAKDALGHMPRLNEDLLDIPANYTARGGAFWLALDERGRVAGMVGVLCASADDIWLKRLYIRPGCKRQGLGTALLRTAETFAREKGATRIHTRFADNYEEAARFYPAMGFENAERSAGCRHCVKTL